jgi:hypothetical protein
MGKISTYSVLSTPIATDKLIGTDVTTNNETKNFTIDSLFTVVVTLPVFANNVAALAGGLVIGRLYQTVTGEVRIVV